MPLRFLLTLALFAACSLFAQDYQIDRYIPESSSSEVSMCVMESSSSVQQMTPAVSSSSATLAKDSTNLAAESSSETSVKHSAKSKPNPYNLPDELMPLWNSMSMRQKAGQMIMVFLTSSQFVIENELGGILLTGKHLRNIDSYKERMTDIDSNLKIPLFTALDQEGGLVNRLVSYSKQWENLPSAREMRHMDSTQIHTLAKKIGSTLKNIRINMNLAPVLDPSKDHRGSNSFMEESRRSWGNDTSNAYKVRAFVNGMRDNGIICVSKHFPGYDSWTNSDLQIAISASPKEKIDQNISFFKTLANDIPVTMMSSVHFLRISSRPAVFDANIVKMARTWSCSPTTSGEHPFAHGQAAKRKLHHARPTRTKTSSASSPPSLTQAMTSS